jgi:hypothetical protein
MAIGKLFLHNNESFTLPSFHPWTTHSKGGAIETNLILKMFLKVVCPPMQSEGFMNWNQYFTPPWKTNLSMKIS